MVNDVDVDLGMLRHTLAALAYRGAKVVGKVPEGFGTFRVKEKSRTPVQIVAHMGDLFDWALSMAKGQERWHESLPQDWDREVDRFFSCVKEFDTYLAGGARIACSRERLFQGPIADAISHVGQLAMLRHMFGTPIRGENYFKADIKAGQVGPVQPAPRKEFG